MSRGGAAGSTGRGGVRASEAVGGGERCWRIAVPRGSHRTDRGLRASGEAASRQRWRR